MVERAIAASLHSPCLSKRGVVLWAPGGDVVATGYNDKPNGFLCTGDASCKSDCARQAVHAEQAALIAAGPRARGAHMLHVKTVGATLVASGGPSCVQCSKLILAAGIARMWLYHEAGWRSYDARGFHRLSLASG